METGRRPAPTRPRPACWPPMRSPGARRAATSGGRPLTSAQRRKGATHHTLVGGFLVTFGHALLGQHAGQSGMLVVHLALRPVVAFGLDDRAKVSALTSGADPRSAGTPPPSLAGAHPFQHAELC